MRKSLIALACLSAVAGAATAAEVELYGTVDTYIAVNHNAGKTDVSLRSGGASASFWGIKGTEDIGPDLKAIFKLESAFLTDTGDFPTAPATTVSFHVKRGSVCTAIPGAPCHSVVNTRRTS